MVWLLIAIPASAVFMGVVITTVALWSSDGLVADDYYRRGLEINRTLDRDRAASLHGLNASVSLDQGGARISVKLIAAPGFAAPDRLQLKLFHATRDGLDRSVVLDRVGTLGYAGVLPELAAGHWDLELFADDWRLNGRIRYPRQIRFRLNNDPSLAPRTLDTGRDHVSG